MKTKTIFTVIILLIVGLAAFRSNEKSTKVDIIKEEFPEAQAELSKVMDAIEASIRTKDADKLISFHVYGPKFTEFRDGAPRFGAEENEVYERGFVSAITGVYKWDWEDLKIDVFGDVANVTFHANFQPIVGQDTMKTTGQVTLLFVKYKGDWKITHEHFSPLIPTTN